jgi:hypothetical protein
MYLFSFSYTFGQTIKRQEGETVKDFIIRLKPDSLELGPQIIETDIWDKKSKSIIAFYEFDNNEIQGHLFIPMGQNMYKETVFGPIEQNGGLPEIISVFFANADKDFEKELIVLCKLEQRHYDYSGQSYETYIFDNPNSKNQLLLNKKLSEKFWGCECSYRDQKSKKAKYKTANDIKIGLIKMGF